MIPPELMHKIIPYVNIEDQIAEKFSKDLEKDNDDFDLKKQHIFIMESVTERRFLHPDNSYENVLAKSLRTCGFLYIRIIS